MLLPRRTLLVLFASAGFTLAGFAQSGGSVPLKFTQIDLTDGRTLKNVVVKSYDSKAEKLLIVANNTAMTIPIALLPPPYNEKLKAAPASGGSVSTSLSPPRPTQALASPADAEATAIAVPSSPAPELHPAPEASPPPAPRSIPSSAPRQKRGSASGDSAPTEASPLQHQFVARSRANRYYRYEHQVGSSSISVTSLEFELGMPQPVPGWAGRCRTEGKAFMEFYDSKGRSFQRATSTFEILTEQKPGEEIKVIDFSRKS